MPRFKLAAAIAVGCATAAGWLLWSSDPVVPERRPDPKPADATSPIDTAPFATEPPLPPRSAADFGHGELSKLAGAPAQLWLPQRRSTAWLVIDAPTPTQFGEIKHLRDTIEAVWIKRDLGAAVVLPPPEDVGAARNTALAVVDDLLALPENRNRRAVLVGIGDRCDEVLRMLADDRVQAVALVDPPTATAAPAQDRDWTAQAAKKYVWLAGPARSQLVIDRLAGQLPLGRKLVDGEQLGLQWLGHQPHRAALVGWLISVLGP
ncbi:MAG: hypothetical protein EXR77_06520 [Myxococcales bacterium]|nr:hypothetical protein [Myxococcales bacterium]